MFTQSSIVGWVNNPFLLHPSAPRSDNTMCDGFCRRLHQQGLAHGKLAIILPGINNFRTKLLAFVDYFFARENHPPVPDSGLQGHQRVENIVHEG